MKVKKISSNIYEVAKEGKMNVPVRIYASEKLLKAIEKDNCLQQMVNVSQLNGIKKNALVLPDAHLGYGFCIGGVAVFDMNTGIISPGGVGYDINCSVRLLKTNLKMKEKEISRKLFNKIPTGVGKGTRVKISESELKEIMVKGAKWAIEKGYGKKEDYELSEEFGCMEEADPSCVSDNAISRGVNQLGSLGSGNHFLEIQAVDEIFDKETAKIFGLEKNQVVIMIHCGSRGFGHQIASDYIKAMEEEYGFENLPDRQLICAPIKSKLGKEYYKAMCCAANFAFCNKQKVCVHRKGATRSYGPDNKDIPKKYQKTGQPILIPGSMGTASYVLKGTKEAEQLSFSSTAHGAGRKMSRHQAMKTLNQNKVEKNLENKGIFFRTGSVKGLLEESPEVYKDVDEVVKISDEVGLGKIVAKLIPKIVIKG